MWSKVRGNSGTIVRNEHANSHFARSPIATVLHANLYHSTSEHCIDGIHNEIGKDLAHFAGKGFHRSVVFELRLQLYAFVLGAGVVQLNNIAYELRDFHVDWR